MSMQIIKVAVPVPLRRVFDYLPNGQVPKRGCRVKVPFGAREMVGVVLSISEHSLLDPAKLKPINSVIDQRPLLDETIMSLCEWASDYYHHPIGEVFAAALPVLLRQGEPAELRHEQYWQLTDAGASLDLTSIKKAPRQVLLINLLRQAEKGLSHSQLLDSDVPPSTIKSAAEKGWIKSFVQLAKPNTRPVEQTLNLNLAQLDAVNKIVQALNSFQPFLLEGVTGSGKTEVYLRVIKEVIANKKQALVLVPEISLTPQTIQRFQERFGVTMAVLHSRLSQRERLNAWLLAYSGQAKIVIGTRSAIFTPIKQLGVIIVDESHDLSYKQQDGFRYSARDLAIRRAQMFDVPVVLGSATPSLESLYNAKVKRFQSLHLPERANSAIAPRLKLVDLRRKQLVGGISKELSDAIARHLSDGHQVLLFLNRRGFAPTMLCHECGWTADCKRCQTHMVIHQEKKRMHCHHCDKTHPIYNVCPNCGSLALHAVGMGTERLEENLKQCFPKTKITRVDRDSTRKKDALKNILEDINQGEPQILIGTQMLAKGHHFPKVTLVGIVDGDSGFFSADFRGVERFAQLLIQVAGRAGRAERLGEVYVQTHQPDNPLLKELLKQGYQAFSRYLLEERRSAALPPFNHLALFRAETPTERTPEAFLSAVKELAGEHAGEVMVLGPIAAPMPKRAGKFRAQLLLQSPNRQALHAMLKQILPAVEELKVSRQVRWSLDVDPLEMF
ncbi:MAG: primosomal protein N' [Legionellaceae bacterium]|nr:primosomal protein N' [Legionellaceae bacterium]